MSIEDEILSELDNLDRKIADLEKREEEERKLKEEAKMSLKKLIEKMIARNFTLQEIAEDLGKSVEEIHQILSI